MKLLRLKVENLKKVKDVTLTPSDNLIIIGGKNGQGKTSLFDSYTYLIEGKGVQCKAPVHTGAKRALITGEFQAEPGDDLNDITVTRTIAQSGNSVLTITSDGLKYPKPQTLLDRIHNRMRDPLAFIHMDRKEQLKLTQDLVGLDFTELNQRHRKIYDDRTEVNREVKRLKGEIEKMEPRYADVPDEEILVSNLKEELEKKEKVNKNIQEKNDALAECKTKIDEISEKIEKLQGELIYYEELHQQAEAQLSEMEEEDTQEIWDKLENAEEINKKIRANLERKETVETLAREEISAQKFSDQLAQIETEKSNQLAAAQFPIEGMSFDEEGVLFEGLPFTENQMATSQMLKVATAMSLALRPPEGTTKLNQIFIYRGSELDRDSQEMIDQLAKEHDAQIFLERVIRNEDDENECQVIIENGVIRGAEVEEDGEDEFGDI